MSFPYPPVPDQEYTHSNGITYIFSDSKKAWEIKYEQATNTAQLPLVNPTGRYLPPAGAALPDVSGLLNQSDYNKWAYDSLIKVDETSRVDSGEVSPIDADTNQLWYKPSTGSLYVYYDDGNSTQWVEIGGGGSLTDIWFGSEPPDEDDDYQFWWDTDRLELLIYFNDQWWPVSIPPAQAELLRQEIDALYNENAQRRLDIAATQQELDTKFFDQNAINQTLSDADAGLSNRIDVLEADEGSDLSQVPFKNTDNLFTETNTFEGNLESDKQLTITAPSSINTDPTFQIKGTSKTGTINSVVLHATQSGSRMRVTYKGPIDSDDEIATKKYVDDAIGPAFHKWIFKPDTDKMDLNPGEFTGPREARYGTGTNYSYYFHPESRTGELEFYKDYDMYFPMNAVWGAFHFLNSGKWRLKQYVPVRDIKMFRDDNYLEILTHQDYPSGGEIISAFTPNTEYYFAIGGMI